MSHSSKPASNALRTVKQRRVELHTALVNLELALAGPASAPSWRAQLAVRVGEVRQAFGRHIHATEDEGGLFAEVMARAPRLEGAVRHLRGEHKALGAALEVISGRVSHDDGNPAELRRAVLGLISEFSRHRQGGADLVFEAYETDVGVAD